MKSATGAGARGLSHDRVLALLGMERRGLVYVIERRELDFGTHWKWDGQTLFTEAGLQLLAEKLEEYGDQEAAKIIRSEADVLGQPTEARLSMAARPAPSDHAYRLPYKEDES